MTQEDIIRTIEDEGVEFVRLQFSDIFGRTKNIAVTPGQMPRVFRNRYSFEGRAIFGGRYECDDKLYLAPILDSFVILPWRPQIGKVAVVTCDVCQEDGTPFVNSTRYILKNLLEQTKEKDYEFIVDPQCEFFLFHSDEHGLPTTVSHESAGYLDVAPSDFGENARHDIVLMLEQMGFEVETSHHEDSPAQHEIDFKEASALKTADAIQNFRFAVRSIAKQFGLYATFMPKPRKECDGASMHINLTMLKGGKNIFRDPDGNPTNEAYHFIGGLLKHGRALTALGNPTVNSFTYLLTGKTAPDSICWGSKGQKTFIKLKQYSNDVKLELRFPDGTSNPYLITAACIAAGIDGIKNKTNPGPDASLHPETKEICADIPGSLKEAIDALASDDVIRETLGDDFTDIYCAVKNAEWRDYMTDVSEWEIGRYLMRT